MGYPEVEADRLQHGVIPPFDDEHIYEEIDDLICEKLNLLSKEKETKENWLSINGTFKSSTEGSVIKPRICTDVKNAKSVWPKEENFYIPMKGRTTTSPEKDFCKVEQNVPLHRFSSVTTCKQSSTCGSSSKVHLRPTFGKEYVDPGSGRIKQSFSDSMYCLGEYIDSWFMTDKKKQTDPPFEVTVTENCTRTFPGDMSSITRTDGPEFSISNKRLNSCYWKLHCCSRTSKSFGVLQDSHVNFTNDSLPSLVTRKFLDACTEVADSDENPSCQKGTRPIVERNDTFNICDDASSLSSYDNCYVNCGAYLNTNTVHTSNYVLLYNKERDKLVSDNYRESTSYKREVSDINWKQDRELYQVNEFCGHKKKQNSVLNDLILRNNMTHI